MALLLLVVAIGRRRQLTAETEAQIVGELEALPEWCEQALRLGPAVDELAAEFADKRHALFLGRGVHYPVAMEGALKLKEISYIHAEAYPAGELKHGPLALVDKEMPVVAVAPNDALRAKLRSNLEEVRARGGILYVFGEDMGGDWNGARVLSHALGRVHRCAGGAHDPAPAPRLPRGGAQGHRHRPAAQPREVRHGGVGGGARLEPLHELSSD